METHWVMYGVGWKASGSESGTKAVRNGTKVKKNERGFVLKLKSM